ncbi:uncharacterized protein LOC130672885 [Microplitis mediator]|uniref:uncharacterized protein LOC130672885 n=1 Tax=Microplitis mediator TaxID=375433 RepID=UPI002555DBF2|nr:uncharacterized protein LOC130672885 [Microplitis mediator]
MKTTLFTCFIVVAHLSLQVFAARVPFNLPPEEKVTDSGEQISDALLLDKNFAISTVSNLMSALGLSDSLDDFLKLNETQILSRVNNLKTALEFDKDESALVINEIQKLSRYDIDDLSKLSEHEIVAILRSIVNILGTNEYAIIGKLLDVGRSSSNLTENRANALRHTIGVLHLVLEKLSRPNEIENLVRSNKNEIVSGLGNFVLFFKMYRGDLLLQSIVNGMKNN